MLNDEDHWDRNGLTQTAPPPVSPLQTSKRPPGHRRSSPMEEPLTDSITILSLTPHIRPRLGLCSLGQRVLAGFTTSSHISLPLIRHYLLTYVKIRYICLQAKTCHHSLPPYFLFFGFLVLPWPLLPKSGRLWVFYLLCHKILILHLPPHCLLSFRTYRSCFNCILLLLKAYLFHKGFHQEKPRITLSPFCTELSTPLMLLDFKFLNGQQLCN